MKPFFLRKKILLQKKIGETPLESIVAWKQKHPRYKDIPATYAGRLDPMASGALLVLLGEECKKKDLYIGYDKTYRVEVLLGVGSDTGDVLGIVTSATTRSTQELEIILQAEVGTYERAYPSYSSKTVDGKPLFLYALDGTIDSIEIPTHQETIYSIRKRREYALTRDNLRERITSLLALAPTSTEPSKRLGADFRIANVQESWDVVLKKESTYYVIDIEVRCGSGAYMRSLCQRIGTKLGTKALALSIHRNSITKKTA